MARFLILILSAGVFLRPAAGFPQKADTGTISGYVYDQASGEALIGANVFLAGTTIGGSSNVSGYFVITGIPQGTYTIEARYIGYKPFSREIHINAGETHKLRIDLEQSIINMQTVVVTADSGRISERLFNKPVSQLEMDARALNRIPQIAEADLLRSLQTLPGILPVSDYSSALYIRGGTPDQNLYLLDGADVYNPEHAFGLFSTFNTDAIKKVEVSKGGFGAEHGGRLSSVLNVTNLDGNRNRAEGVVAISLLSAKSTLQFPLGDFGSLSGSLRRTYFDKTVGKAIDDIPEYYFYDGNIKAFIDIDHANKLTISGFGGQDNLDVIFNPDADNSAGFNYVWGNRTGSVRWTHLFSPRLFMNMLVTGSRFASDFGFTESIEVSEYNTISDITVKGDFEFHGSEKLIARFGLEQKTLRTVYQHGFPGGRVDVRSRSRHTALYGTLNWRPSPLWDVRAGVRGNYFSSDSTFLDFSPRFSAKYRLTETTNLKFASGRYFQYLHRIPRPFFADIWTTSNKYQSQSRSDHFIFGFEQEIAEQYSLEIETYYKSYRNLFSFNYFLITEIEPGGYENNEPVYTTTDGLFNRGDGFSRGLELLLRRDTGAITGWIGYALARTEYTVDGINQGRSYPPRHDRTSTVNIVANIDIKNALRELRGAGFQPDKSSWQLGLNFVYSSGQPITLPSSAYTANATPDYDGSGGFGNGPTGNASFQLYPTTINAYRLPPYARLDLSITWRRSFGSWSMTPYLQIYNIGNRKNVWFVLFEDESTEEQIVQNARPFNMLPLLPTFGISFHF